eukprot:Em0005g1613a
MEDGFLAECSAKIPFGYQAAYRGVYGTKMNGAPCIVKSLRDILAGAGDVSPEQVAGATGRFRDECALLSKLRHPNVLQFLGVQVGSEASDITLVLECPHTTLDDCLGRRKAALSLTVALSILRDVSLGLLYLHSRASPSTAHGDLHARNVLLMKDMTAKIADLGATKILGYSLAAPETLDHLPSDAIAALRTAPFLSNSSYKVDIFSFGVLCLHVAVDSAGNEGESLPIEAMLDHAQHSPLHPLVLNCLHDDQEKRPSAGEVCTEMDGLCSKFPRESKDILEVQEELAALTNRYSQLLEAHGQIQQKQARKLTMNDVSLPSSLNLMAILRSFPKLSAAGPSGLRIQHLIDAAEITLQTPILHLLRKVINILASGKAPVDVSIFLAGGNLTALQKSKPGCPLDVRPIAVGEALRRLVGKCLCSMLKSKAAEFFDPLQRGVACAAGAEKIAHGLRGCMDENWQAEGFTVLKIDLVNAFNLVSRHALLSECSTHFPELLPWVSWCYSRHPVLWHTLGNLTSQSGVQQGDPLGPLLFSLVLNVVVKAIATHPECSDLSYHVWYLDDGALAGPSSHVRKALSLLIELGPPLGLHVNIKKCEVFSSGCLSHFPMEMKQSSKPNLEILGIPIGDSVFCRAVLDRKRSEAGVLLKRLEDVGEVDPQVALVLLRLCGGYCKLVHLARAVPPSFSQSVLQLFDQDVQKCFTSCTGVHPSIAAWKQAQLSLSRGGLGLRSLSHHAPAAFIASLCFSGLGSISHVHLLQSLEIFNSSVHQSDNIQIGSVLEKLPSQKTLSSILDNNLFRVLQGSLSIADRARLLSASSPHASSWLTVTPSEGQGLHLDPPVFQTALKWWLGLDTTEGSICALCPDKMLDPLGHHATTCKRGGDVVFRHNKLRDILAETCRRAHLSVQVEAGCNLTPDHSHSRPADVLISNWVLGKTAACDISVTSPLNSNIMSEAGVTAGAAAQATELRKHEANDVKCSELGWLCIPLVVESYGAWGKEAMESFSSLASRLAITSSRPKSAVLSELYGRLNLNLTLSTVTWSNHGCDSAYNMKCILSIYQKEAPPTACSLFIKVRHGMNATFNTSLKARGKLVYATDVNNITTSSHASWSYLAHISAHRESMVVQGPSHILPPGSVKSFGHVFEKKTYFQPTYCQHCTKMLWGLKEQGLECRVCNFISHERCALQLVVPCLQATPPGENTGGEHHLVRMEQCDGKAFCSVCRRRITSGGVFCQVCHQYTHAGCGTILFKACRDCASYSKQSKNAHHWIEGNLPAGSLCGVCGKGCGTSDCLSGFRCCWCGVTIHSSCKSSYHQGNCDYGDLKPIILLPRAVYTRPSLLISQAIPEELSSDAHTEHPFSPGLEQRQCTVMDGRLLTLPVTRATTAHDILTTGVRMLASSYEGCHLVEVLEDGEEKPLPSTQHLFSLQRGSDVMRLVIQQKKPGSQRDVIISNGCLPSSLGAVEVSTTALATASEIIAMSLRAFQIEGGSVSDYCLVEVCSDVKGREMKEDQCPLKNTTETSPSHQYILRQRYGYEGIMIYLWGIPQDVLPSEATYTQHVKGIIDRASPGLLTEGLLHMVKIGPTFPTHGGLFIEFPTVDVACKVCAALQESQVKVSLLPSIYPDQLDEEQEVLLVFINERSGGNQGRSLLSGFRRHLNPYQVFNLAEGGPLPGLFAFRKVKRFSVLIGGGDGTFGWVLSSITDIQPLLTCDNPPCALLPLGTGNDLARALKWGPGYTGEKVMDILNGLRGGGDC